MPRRTSRTHRCRCRVHADNVEITPHRAAHSRGHGVSTRCVSRLTGVFTGDRCRSQDQLSGLTRGCGSTSPRLLAGRWFRARTIAAHVRDVTETCFDVVDERGTPYTVWPATEADTVGDLARALGYRSADLRIGGEIVPADRRLLDVASLRAGVEVGDVSDLADASDLRPTATSQIGQPVCEVAVVGGTACTGWWPLAAGRHWIGRAPSASIRIEDASVEPYHALLDVAPDGRCRFVQLTGWVPATVATDDGRHVAVTLRAHRIEVRPWDACDRARGSHRPAAAGSLVSGAEPWRRVVRRGPASSSRERDGVVPPDEPAARRPTPATGLIGAALSVVGALVAALVFGSALFAVFALLAGSASGATWLAARLGASREQRRARRRYAADSRRFVDELEALGSALATDRLRTTPPLPDAIGELERLHDNPTTAVWERRISAAVAADGGAPAVHVTIGTGRVRLPIDLAGGADAPADVALEIERQATRRSLPARITLNPGEVVALAGDTDAAASIARGAVVQLATWYGPADVEISIVSTDRARWEWSRWLPHVTEIAIDGLGDRTGAGERRHGADERLTVIVLDDVQPLTDRSDPIRRALDSGRAAALVVVPSDSTVPARCSRTLWIGSRAMATWNGEIPTSDRADSLMIAGIDTATAERAARVLASLVDPETPRSGSHLPAEVALDGIDGELALDGIDGELALDGIDGELALDGRSDPLPTLAATICERWRASHGRPASLVGTTATATVDVDLVRDGPHALIAGTTGSGKSELLRTLVVGLATRCAPTDLGFVLVDYKGGAAFDACTRLPHVVGLVTDLDDGLAERALLSVEAELRRREQALRRAGVNDFEGLCSSEHARIPRIVVIVDEFASLAAEHPTFLSSLVSAAQRGRSLGIHLVLATQRPAGVVSDDIAANSDLRIALRLRDATDSRDVLGDAAAAAISKRTPGRAVVRRGDEAPLTFQAARCSLPPRRRPRRLRVAPSGLHERDPLGSASSGPTSLDWLVDGVRRATERAELVSPDPLWLPALPATLDHAQLRGLFADEAAIGIVDDPLRQARHPLRWHPGDGHLQLVGDAGSGVTTTILRLVESACRATPPTSLHVYVIDAIGDEALLAIDSLPHCAAVVRSSERERVVRVLRRLRQRLDQGERVPRILLVIDGYGALRDSMINAGWLDQVADLRSIVDHGAAVGVETLLSSSAGAASSLSANIGHRWIFRSARGSATVTGASTPGRLWIEPSGLEAQVARPPPRPGRSRAAADPPGGPVPISTLPSQVDLADLPTSGPPASPGEHALTIGLGFDDLAAATLVIPHGDHVMILGHARSGRSTALEAVVAAWRARHPDGRTISIEARSTGTDRSFGAAQDVLDASRRVGTVPVLFAIDDAERLADPDGTLDRLLADVSNVLVVATARLDAVRSAYGHWTRTLCQSRCGIVLTSGGDVDADPLGCSLPRRPIIEPRPGLGWLIDGRGPRLAQIAARLPP